MNIEGRICIVMHNNQILINNMYMYLNDIFISYKEFLKIEIYLSTINR